MRRSICYSCQYVACVIGLLVIAIISAESAHSDENKAAKEVTVITSQTLVADNTTKTAIFEGTVVARKGDMTLHADKMLVFYTDEKGGGSVSRIDAEGNVKLVKGERVITAASATYLLSPVENVVFSGSPRATDGENVVTGTKMTFYIKEDRSVVTDSKAFLVDKQQKK